MDGLRKEAQRKLYRAQKKLSKANDRASKCEARQEALLTEDMPIEVMEAALESLEDCKSLRAQAAKEEERLQLLQELVSGLQSEAETGFASRERSKGLVRLAAELDVSDSGPVRPAPRPKKPKGPRASTKPRLPYRVFRSESGAEIRVGKQAKDNDLLSIQPEHRDNEDWWLHASGCPGSHVIVRAQSVGQASLPRDVELDAAVLAANYSKAPKSGVVGVNLCRARQVSKPAGAKAGLVQLQGDVKTIRLNWKNEKRRLERLADTVSAE